MRVVYTDEALHDLEDILRFIATNFPTAYPSFELRLRAIERRIGQWPQSAREVAERPGVRVVPLVRYPYRIFYRVTPDAIEILHIHHTARPVVRYIINKASTEGVVKLDQLATLVEKLRKEAIGEPLWMAEKEVFEYPDRSAKVVALLKLVRAAHGVGAIDVLCRAGFFIDFGALIRGINDSVSEIYFLLERFPNTSDNVNQFITEFFSRTIDNYLSDETPQVPTKKIRSAVVRVLKGSHDDTTHKLLERIFKIFSGYVHASYSHIMEVYNGNTLSFNLRGVPSFGQRNMRMQHVDATAISVLHAAAFIAQTLNLKELHCEAMKLGDT